MSLQFANEELKADKNIVLSAVTNGKSIHDAKQKSKEFMLEVCRYVGCTSFADES